MISTLDQIPVAVQEIDRAVADDLVRDVRVAARGVRSVRTLDDSRGLYDSPSHGWLDRPAQNLLSAPQRR